MAAFDDVQLSGVVKLLSQDDVKGSSASVTACRLFLHKQYNNNRLFFIQYIQYRKECILNDSLTVKSGLLIIIIITSKSFFVTITKNAKTEDFDRYIKSTH